jgi:glutamate 5-kinase
VGFDRIVIKVGTSILTSPLGVFDKKYLTKIVKDISQLREEGKELLLVTSGGNRCRDRKAWP